MTTKREALEEIARNPGSARVAYEVKSALQEGSDSALIRALVDTKRFGMTLHVVNIANKQLGYPSNHTE